MVDPHTYINHYGSVVGSRQIIIPVALRDVGSSRKRCDCGYGGSQVKCARASHGGKEENDRVQYAINGRENLPGLMNEYLLGALNMREQMRGIGKFLERSGIKPDY